MKVIDPKKQPKNLRIYSLVYFKAIKKRHSSHVPMPVSPSGVTGVSGICCLSNKELLELILTLIGPSLASCFK